MLSLSPPIDAARPPPLDPELFLQLTALRFGLHLEIRPARGLIAVCICGSKTCNRAWVLGRFAPADALIPLVDLAGQLERGAVA